MGAPGSESFTERQHMAEKLTLEFTSRGVRQTDASRWVGKPTEDDPDAGKHVPVSNLAIVLEHQSKDGKAQLFIETRDKDFAKLTEGKKYLVELTEK
jgi:hypothetical protein